MPLSEKKKASNARWDAANLRRMSLAIPLELYERLKAHTEKRRETTNGFIKRAIDETISRDNRVTQEGGEE